MDEVSATWSSRVRGLFLGLALGDAVGSMRGDIPSAGPLAAGAATQLAAWTAEGTLRMHTRYADPLREADTDLVLFAYQRWALLRGAEPAPDAPWFPLLEVRDLPTRGWLVDVPAMAGTRGSSPSTFSAVTTGIPVRSSGCQAMLRSLPLAAYLGRSVGSSEERRPLVTDLTRRLAALTHSHPDAAAAAAFAVELAGICLNSVNFSDGIDIIRKRHANRLPSRLQRACLLGRTEPCVPDTLAALAPHRTGTSALAGAVYVALSFVGPDSVAEAIEFAGWAPDGDSVAATAGAFLAALYGYESLPADVVERLDLGWVMDRLAVDTIACAAGADVHADPWWSIRYPAV